MKFKKSILLVLILSFIFSCSNINKFDLDIKKSNNIVFKLNKDYSIKDFENVKSDLKINTLEIISKDLKIFEVSGYSNQNLRELKNYLLNDNKLIDYYYDNSFFKPTIKIKPTISDFEKKTFSKSEIDLEWNYKSINLQEDKVNKKEFLNKVTIAVLDTGIDSSKKVFNKNVLPMIDLWNEQIGDDFGYINNKKIDYKNRDGNGHGTFISGIINEIINKTNTSNNINILPIKISNSNGESSPNLIAKGIFVAIKNNAKVINISLGGDPEYNKSQYLNDAITFAKNQNVVLIAAAGNESNRLSKINIGLNTPAFYPEVISVGAINKYDEVTNYSNSDKHLDIVAPGGSDRSNKEIEGKIFSLWPNYETFRSGEREFYNEYTHLSGTSVSTAHVSAVLALILSKNALLTVNQARLKVLATSTDINFRGFDENSGYGKLNAFDAIYIDD